MKDKLFNFFYHRFEKDSKADRKTFNKLASFTLIVYFIAAICGWVNLFFAHYMKRVYYPLRSYLISFDKEEISNYSAISHSVFNFSGYRAQIDSLLPYKTIDDVFFVSISILLIVLFMYGYYLVKSNKVNETEIISWSIGFATLMAIAIPTHSSDLYGYIARGAQQILYNQNPYFETVNSIENYHLNPLFFNFMWTSTPTTYGPIFIYLTKLVTYLSNSSFLFSFINFKLQNLTCFLLIILFLQKLKSPANLYLIAWNPFILLQGLWNNHNDLLSGTAIFMGLFFYLKKVKNIDYFLSGFFLAVAAGIKYVSILILPFILADLFKQKNNKTSSVNFILGIIAGFVLIGIFSVEYIPTYEKLQLANFTKLTDNIGLAHKSLIATIFTIIKYSNKLFQMNLNMGSVLSLLKTTFAFIYLCLYLYVFASKRFRLIEKITMVLLGLFLFAMSKFHSWYLLNLIFLIPFLSNGFLRELLKALSLTHIFAITFLDQAKILNFITMTLSPIMLLVSGFKKKKNS